MSAASNTPELPTSTARQSLRAATGSASDLPGCIRRELRKMKAEDERIGYRDADPECQEAVAFMRWAKRLKGEELSTTILTVMDRCVRERTCMAAKLAEAARRLRKNDKVRGGANNPRRNYAKETQEKP